MNLIDSHQTRAHVLPGYLTPVASQRNQSLHRSSHKKEIVYPDLGELPAHAFDENDGVPLSPKENKLIWLAIVMGQIILGLTIYAIL